MCGGGGGGGGNDSTYYQNIYNDQINQQNRILEQQRQDALAAQAKADAEKQAAKDKFTTDLASAKTGAQTVAQKYFSDRGIPLDQSLVDSIINQVSVPDLDPNPASYYTPSIFEAGVNQAQDAQRQKYSNLVDSTFAPGFERSLISDSAADPIVSAILGEQRSQAQQILDYNRARGLLNDTGYNTALANLNTQGTSAKSTLGDLANSVLGRDRSELTDIRGEAGTAASGYDYGAAAPDIGSYYTRATQHAASDLSGLEGSIRGALGSTNLFDPATAIAKGGTTQGPINLTTAGADFTPSITRTASRNRGLGSTGVF